MPAACAAVQISSALNVAVSSGMETPVRRTALAASGAPLTRVAEPDVSAVKRHTV